ncbi:MAG TPA: cyclic nucleotide-binding domain-containing protein, partial [Polyangiaceae bacterium LLY-WYZ-14_1]|nr:cyclic nucleotide-binding domain-containing protein [Polyangiaceae bacterium LLY-WYZ-14_1]
GLGRDVEGLTAYPDRLPPIPLFSLLPPEAFASVLRALTLVRVGPGEVILRQGAPGEAFYVIARGRVRVHREERGGGTTELATLYEGAIFGEMALLSASPRTATVTAEDATDLLEFGREALSAAAGELEVLAEALDRFTRDRMVQNVLRSSPIFRPLDDAQRMDLFKRFTTHHLPAGAEVVTQGAPGAGLFLVLSGVVTVERQGADGGPTVALARLGAGELFGELSLLRNEPASATVRTATPAALLFLARAYVDRLVAAVPAIAAYVEGLAEQRLLDTEEALAADEIPIDVEI